MATAESKTARVQKWVEEPVYSLTLTPEEAGVLMSLLGGGVDYDTVWSALGMDDVYYALEGAGAKDSKDISWQTVAKANQ